MGRDIESRQGICWVLAFLKEEKKGFRSSQQLLGNCNALLLSVFEETKWLQY
jgi:hypothetical protein